MGNQIHGGRVHCTFCGGKACKHEDFRKQGGESAINGLHSNWVTPDLLAMQRPSTRLIKEHDVLKQFKENKIGAVINCQIPNEHAFCGDGIDPRCGYSYCAEDLAQEEIHFYEFGWVDMSVPTLERMMNIVQVVDFVVRSGRKVAVHCHAGLGRTGLVIACYMMYADKLGGIEAREAVRAKRPGSVQSKAQEMFLLEFEALLASRRLVFPDAAGAPRFTLEEALERQRAYLHGEERRLRRRLPKVVEAVCGRLQGVAAARLHPPAAIAEALAETGGGEAAGGRVAELKRALNGDRWGPLEAECEPRVLAGLLLSWLEQLQGPVVTPGSDPRRSVTPVRGKTPEAAKEAGSSGDESAVPLAPAALEFSVRRAARPTLEAVGSMLRSVSSAPEGALRAACGRLARALLQAPEGAGAAVDALALHLEASPAASSPPTGREPGPAQSRRAPWTPDRPGLAGPYAGPRQQAPMQMWQ